jgi:glycosyltransferase involved in cell wall biosynthesis
MRLGFYAAHPIQYLAPVLRALARHPDVELKVYFGHRPAPAEQGHGFNHAFLWNDDPARGFDHDWLDNTAVDPGLHHFGGISTPTIHEAWEEDRPDQVIITGWTFRGHLQAMDAAVALGIPYATWGDSQLDPRRGVLWRWVHRLTRAAYVRRASTVFAFGERSEAYFRHLGAPQVQRIPHTIDGELFASRIAAVSVAEAREKCRVRPEAKVVLFAGKFIPKKRPELLLEEFARVAQPDWQLLLVGDGPLRTKLEAKARQLKIDAVFAGFLNQTEMPAAYHAADLLVLPSTFEETWGLVANEAIACGCPVLLSSACGSVPELTAPPVAAAVFPWRETAQLGEKMRELLAAPDVRRQLREAGFERSREWTPHAAAEAIVRGLPPMR